MAIGDTACSVTNTTCPLDIPVHYARPHKQITYVCLLRSVYAKLLVVWTEIWKWG